MAFTSSNLSLRDREFHKFTGAVGAGSETPVSVVLASGNIHIGSVSANVDSIYVQSGDNINITDVASAYIHSGIITTVGDLQAGYLVSGDTLQVEGKDAVSAATSVNPVYIGGRAISGVPTEVTSADAVDFWLDTYGRPVLLGANLGQSSLDVSEVAPALTQTINTTNLDAVGSSAGSNVGAWVNMSDFNNKTIYYSFTSGTTGSMHMLVEASPNAGSDVYVVDAGSLWLESDTNDYFTNTEHHEYIRARTDFNEGGTLSVIFTGRGG